jgi:hypothetical protein
MVVLLGKALESVTVLSGTPAIQSKMVLDGLHSCGSELSTDAHVTCGCSNLVCQFISVLGVRLARVAHRDCCEPRGLGVWNLLIPGAWAGCGKATAR